MLYNGGSAYDMYGGSGSYDQSQGADYFSGQGLQQQNPMAKFGGVNANVNPMSKSIQNPTSQGISGAAVDPFNVNFNPDLVQSGSNALDPSKWMGANDIIFGTNNGLWKNGMPDAAPGMGSGTQNHYDLTQVADIALRNIAQPSMWSGQGLLGNPSDPTYSPLNQFRQLWDPNNESSTWSPFDAAQRAQTWEQAINNFQNGTYGGLNYSLSDDQRSQLRDQVQNAYQDILNRARSSGAMGMSGTNIYDPNNVYNPNVNGGR